MSKITKLTLLLGLALAALASCSRAPEPAKPVEQPVEVAEVVVSEPEPLIPQSDQEKLAYSIGYFTGEQLAQFTELPTEFLSLGVSAGYSGSDPLLEQNDMQSRAIEAQRLLGERRSAERDQQAEERRQQMADRALQGQQWLAANLEQEGIVVTESGLQYQVIEEGNASVNPGPDSVVTVHYSGSLIDGNVFDSSYSRNQPTTFALNAVIAGWQEGLQLMGPGSKYKLFIPPQLGYGERGAGSSIGPNEVLIFEVELLSFE